MSTDGTITGLIRDLEDGVRREEAARALWEHYFAGLVRFALKKLRAMHALGGPADEEDAAERAFTKVCRGIESGRLKLGGRTDLLRLLLKATEREAINQFHSGRRRAVGEVDGSVLPLVPDDQPAPEQVALACEACRRLLDLLGDDRLRRIALSKLAGHTNAEIARRLGCSLATIERKLERVRAKWAAVAPECPAKPARRYAGAGESGGEVGGLTTVLNDLNGRPPAAGNPPPPAK